MVLNTGMLTELIRNLGIPRKNSLKAENIENKGYSQEIMRT